MRLKGNGSSMNTIGIRAEDKSKWEARTPIVPDDVRRLVDAGLPIHVQPSATRAFSDAAYREAGAVCGDDLSACEIIMGVKEIPIEKLDAGKVYLNFSHTIKGQSANMPVLRRHMELGNTLIDYERIVDEQDRRLVFFGRFAGLAGMIDTLWTLGKRLAWEGIENPFELVKPAHQYADLAQVRDMMRRLANTIASDGLPESICPFICAFTGYGQVSRGAQEIYDLLPMEELAPADVAAVKANRHKCYKVEFKEEHLVRRVDASVPFDLREYYDHPERYEADFFQHVEHLALLVNGIYWEPKYPRFITVEQFASLYPGNAHPKLRVVGDITCDIDGSLACTTHATSPDDPVYVYNPETRETTPGVEGTGPVVLAVDFLPCELPIDASLFFSRSLRDYVILLSQADFSKDLAQTGLPAVLQRATIVHRGRLTEPYEYLNNHL